MATCPKCGDNFVAGEVGRGAALKCPTCRHVFDAEPAPAEATGANSAAASEADTKACPYCGETIKRVAIKCKHCGSDLSAGPDAVTALQQQNPFYASGGSESTVFEGSSSQWTNLGRFLLCLVVAVGGAALFFVNRIPSWAPIGVLAIAVLLALIAYLKVRVTVYRVTSERIEIERGLISKRVDNIDLFRLKDIRLNINLLQRLVGIGNITVVSEDSTDPKLELRGLPDPRPIYDHLKREALQADRRRGVIHVES